MDVSNGDSAKSPPPRTRRIRLVLILIAALAVFAAVAGGQSANAATNRAAAPQDHTISDSVTYDVGWTFVSGHLGACMHFQATGKITYTIDIFVSPRQGSAYWTWTKQTIHDPELKLTVSNSKCRGSKDLTKVHMAQSWAGYSCTYNPSIAVSYPWGISFSDWPDCGDRTEATYHTSYGKGTVYEQYNSGSPTEFGDYTSIFQSSGGHPTPPCYGVFASGTFYIGNKSDSYGAGNAGDNARSVCLNKY
jgi:hypothetical protein